MIGDAISGTLGGAGAGAGIATAVSTGASAGPIGAAIGAGVGLVSGLLGGSSKKKAASKQKAAQKKAVRKTHKYNKKVWKYNNAEAERKYDHQVESLNIRQDNDTERREYTDKINNNNYNHAMAIRDYEFSQATRAYEASVAAADEQISFNQIASNFAVKQQDRYAEEMIRGMMFDEKQTLANYALQSAGFENQRNQIINKKRSSKADATFKTQAERIKGLKASGEAAARGPGRSNAKAVQAAMAEAGANQAAIAEELMFGLTDLNISLDAVRIKTEGMSNQLIIDQAKLAASVSNLNANDKLAREQIAFNLKDANRRARAAIPMRPEMTPPMPKPIALPKPEYQDIYKPKKPPKPKKGASAVLSTQPSMMGDVGTAAMGMVQSFQKAGIFSGGGYSATPATSSPSMFNAGGYLSSTTSSLASLNLSNVGASTGLGSSFSAGSFGGMNKLGLSGPVGDFNLNPSLSAIS
tara:strand:- start:410 stop:1816 length:1407 start_codon:yes stop_codon:yes gene_type:complete